jgi:hypothetical protein
MMAGRIKHIDKRQRESFSEQMKVYLTEVLEIMLSDRKKREKIMQVQYVFLKAAHYVRIHNREAITQYKTDYLKLTIAEFAISRCNSKDAEDAMLIRALWPLLPLKTKLSIQFERLWQKV